MKDKLRASLRKRKKLIKKLSESHELIEQLEDQSGSKELDEAIADLMTNNKRLKQIIA